MANGRGLKLNPRSSGRIIDKRAGKIKKQKASRINSNSDFIHTAAPNYAFAPPYPNVPAPAPALASAASCNWVAVQEVIPGGDQISGYIFMCNGITKVDCYKYRVFGLPAARMEVVEKIKPHMKLFLFDFDLKLLYGIYIATSNGRSAIEPTAFGGKFSAQVRFEIFEECLPLPENAFKHVIKYNYRGGSKFRQELSDEQVANLVLLFRPIAMPPRITNVSLMPNPVSIRAQTQPAAELSASYDQYLAGLQHTHAGGAHDCLHVRQAGPYFPRLPHASTANMAVLQPAVESMRILPEVPQHQCDPYYPLAHQAYVPENPVLHNRFTAVPNDCGRGALLQLGTTNSDYHQNMLLPTPNAPAQAYALVPSQFSMPAQRHSHLPYSPLTAAYWAQKAAEDPKQVYCPHQMMPISFAGATPAYPAVAENRGNETVLQSGIMVNDYNNNLAPATTNAPTVKAQFQAPSSSFPAAYWAAVASGGTTGLVAENVPASFLAAPSSLTAVAENSEKQMVSNLGDGYDEHGIAVSSAANVPTQTYVRVPSQVTAPYWTVVASEGSNQVYSGPPPLPENH